MLSRQIETIKNDNMKMKRVKYYLNDDVINNILGSCINKEMVFMDKYENWKCIRGLNIKSKKKLLDSFDEFNFFKKNYCIYLSLASYLHLGSDAKTEGFSSNLKIRSQETSDFFENRAKKEMLGYDILLDFDFKKLDESSMQIQYNKKILNDFINILNQHKITYFMYPSSKMGFHIVLPYETTIVNDFKFTDERFYNSIMIFVKNLKERFNLINLDLIGVGQQSKIRKCQYSLNDDFCILPLTTLDNFNPDYLDSNNVLKMNIKNKNTPLINYENEQINMMNFSFFCDKFNLLYEG